MHESLSSCLKHEKLVLLTFVLITKLIWGHTKQMLPESSLCIGYKEISTDIYSIDSINESCTCAYRPVASSKERLQTNIQYSKRIFKSYQRDHLLHN